MTDPINPRIFLRCSNCGNAAVRRRLKIDPPEAVECVHSECHICDRGEFVEAFYFDREGREIPELEL